MKKNFMLIGLLAFVLFFVAPMSAEAAEGGTWKNNANGWWYEFADGTYLADGFAEIGGVTYYFDAAGWMKTGWVYVEAEVEEDMEPYGDWYYFNNSGAMVKGWVQSGADWYYMDPVDGYMWTNSVVDNTYFVDYDGKMLTDDYIYGYLYDGRTGFDASGRMIKNGWLLIAEYDTYGWAYFDANGQSIDEGWVKDGSSWYYMANGLARVGTYLMDYEGQTHLYKFATDGRMVVDKVATKGWIEADGCWYYYDVTPEYEGLVRNAWKAINGEWYYFSSQGQMRTNDVVWDDEYGCYYVVASDGSMVKNQWLNIGSAKYPTWVYADGNGVAYMDRWLQQGNTWYYFDWVEMVNATTKIDGVWNLFNKSGAWLGTSNVTNGWVDAGDGKWFYLENGELAYGWRLINNTWYYFDEYSGRMAADGVHRCKNSDGSRPYYVFNADGALTKGWYQDSRGAWCYGDAEGKALDEEWVKEGNTWYYIGRYWMAEDGVLSVYNESEDTYESHIFAKGGAWLGKVAEGLEGWQYIGNKWYYYEYDEPIWGFKKIDGKVYAFENAMLTNDYYYLYLYEEGCEGIHLGAEYVIGFDANGNIAKNQWIYVDWCEEWIWFDANGYGILPGGYYGGM